MVSFAWLTLLLSFSDHGSTNSLEKKFPGYSSFSPTEPGSLFGQGRSCTLLIIDSVPTSRPTKGMLSMSALNVSNMPALSVGIKVDPAGALRQAESISKYLLRHVRINRLVRKFKRVASHSIRRTVINHETIRHY